MRVINAQCNNGDNGDNVIRPMSFLQLRDVLKKTAQSKSQWYLMIQRKTAPAPIKIGRSSVWLESDIERWMTDQVRASRGETPTMKVA